MYGFADYESYFIGEDPLDLERHAAVLANIEFHAGRPWPLDVALWDLAGKIADRPLWDLLGGRDRRVRAYASSGVHRSVGDMVAVARQARRARVPCPQGALRARRPRRRPGRRAGDPRRGRRRAGADGRLQPGLADAVGCSPALGRRPCHRRRRAADGRAGLLDGGAAAPRRLRRDGRAAPAGRRPRSPAAN